MQCLKNKHYNMLLYASKNVLVKPASKPVKATCLKGEKKKTQRKLGAEKSLLTSFLFCLVFKLIASLRRTSKQACVCVCACEIRVLEKSCLGIASSL